MKNLKDFNLKNKRVLVRCDFNVPLDDKGNILDDFRIEKTIPTIKYLIKENAKVILMGHLGKPKGKKIDILKMDKIQESLAEHLNLSVTKSSDCIGKKIENYTKKEMKNGEILLLENLRFHKEEEEGDSVFAKSLAKLGDIYINDAFGVSHRNHSSVTKAPKYLPRGMGLLLEEEINVFSQKLNNPQRPLVAIIGGAKIETKIKTIKKLLEKSDHLLLGGKVANSVLSIQGLCYGKEKFSDEIKREVEKISLTSTKLHLPVDALVSPNINGNLSVKELALAKTKKGDLLLDIGPETIDIFSNIIKEAKTIIWAGPLGLFENPAFEKGTKEIIESISNNKKCFKIAGGGDTIFAISKFKKINDFNHISTGGGAMLDFIGNETLPGLEALSN